MSAEQTPDIAAVLAEHFVLWADIKGGPRGEWRCECGQKFGLSDTAIAHVAAALAPVLAAAVREAEQRALREAAEDFNHECLSLKDGAWSVQDVPVLAFGTATLRWLRDRADRITEPVSHEAATSGEEASKA